MQDVFFTCYKITLKFKLHSFFNKYIIFISTIETYKY